MINKRLLIKNLLSHSDENTFFDKKLKIINDVSGLEYDSETINILKKVVELSNKIFERP